MARRAKPETVAASADITDENKVIGKVSVYHGISEEIRLRQELEAVKQGLRRVEMKYTFEDILGYSPEFASVVRTAKNAAITPASILLEGESGTGKEVLAQAIHNASRRRTQNFVKIDCSGLSSSSAPELFGFADGRASYSRAGGIIGEADRGTLYLANIERLPEDAQRKLLAVMTGREACSPGIYGEKRIDVRFLSSSKIDLGKVVSEGGFLQELYDRLSVFHLRIPPLRERPSDIGLIARYLINQYNDILNRHINDIEPSAIEMLKEQHWSGNVRGLESLLSKTIISMDECEDQIKKIHILSLLEKTPVQSAATADSATGINVVVKLNDAVNETERVYIINALERNGGDKNKAAAELDIPLRTLYYKCKKLRIL
jgi:transcriptional regulator with PAS, ATPase and Fis domain